MGCSGGSQALQCKPPRRAHRAAGAAIRKTCYRCRGQEVDWCQAGAQGTHGPAGTFRSSNISGAGLPRGFGGRRVLRSERWGPGEGARPWDPWFVHAGPALALAWTSPAICIRPNTRTHSHCVPVPPPLALLPGALLRQRLSHLRQLLPGALLRLLLRLLLRRLTCGEGLRMGGRDGVANGWPRRCA